MPSKNKLPDLSVIIPAYNEEQRIEGAVDSLFTALEGAGIDLEAIAVYDTSSDGTEKALERLAARHHAFSYFHNAYEPGVGTAIATGLDRYRGRTAAIYVADAADDPEDLVCLYRKFEEGFDCVFGSRFIEGGSIEDYPQFKLMMNRIINLFLRLAFGLRTNDVTNGFKLYGRHVIDGIKPIKSKGFDIALELPLKAAIRGYSYVVIPTRWHGQPGKRSNMRSMRVAWEYFARILECMHYRLTCLMACP